MKIVLMNALDLVEGIIQVGSVLYAQIEGAQTAKRNRGGIIPWRAAPIGARPPGLLPDLAIRKCDSEFAVGKSIAGQLFDYAIHVDAMSGLGIGKAELFRRNFICTKHTEKAGTFTFGARPFWRG